MERSGMREKRSDRCSSEGWLRIARSLSLGLAKADPRAPSGLRQHRSPLRNERPRGISRAIVVEIDVPAFVVPDEALGLMRQREQPLPEPDRDDVVARAVHDQERRLDG